ncbi:hypothetical protein HBH53_039380 [Parastagonospora nodorum]|nr:hypothetical protein HBH53_039380 [Parastagonospora nodorum]KAH4848786.1 hypothetical protein HBH75_149580 [Parastagonospora nodorum]KAH5181770.1 hypothetical protein HBH76_157470 [Parastagonospora nodorum]KAH5365024.1 hypothetical protein HBI49_109950 [Parastagonospora nodorum]KAH5381579.1 hypothetical protein HBI33_138710 [Parastagonospora nodorum]
MEGQPLPEYDSLPGEESSSDEDEDDIPPEGELAVHSRTTVQHLSMVLFDPEKHSGVVDVGECIAEYEVDLCWCGFWYRY